MLRLPAPDLLDFPQGDLGDWILLQISSLTPSRFGLSATDTMTGLIKQTKSLVVFGLLLLVQRGKRCAAADTPLETLEGRGGAGEAPGQILHRFKRSLPSTAEKQQIVEKHNELRRIPRASNMRELVG